MAVVVVDAAPRDTLLAGGQVAEVRDSAGRVLGKFVAGADVVVDSAHVPQISEEELDRRSKSGRWHTAEQVMDRLRSLGHGR